MTEPVLIVAGPPGSGKSTVARLVASRERCAVQIEADVFFRFVRAGYVEPWRPESHGQNAVVMRAVAAAASRYAAGGYLTVVDGIVMPGWFFEPLRDQLRADGLAVAYAVLRAPLRTCLERVAGRERFDPGVVERLWNQFADLGPLERHVVETGGRPPEAVDDEIRRRLAGDLLTD